MSPQRFAVLCISDGRLLLSLFTMNTEALPRISLPKAALIRIELKRVDAEKNLLEELRQYRESRTFPGDAPDDSFFAEESCSPMHIAEYVRDYALALIDSSVSEVIAQEPEFGDVLAALPGIASHVLNCILPPASDDAGPGGTCLMDMAESYGNFLDRERLAAESAADISGSTESIRGDWERLIEESWRGGLELPPRGLPWFSLELQLRFSLRSARNRAYFSDLVTVGVADHHAKYRLECEAASLRQRLTLAVAGEIVAEGGSSCKRSQAYAELESGRTLRDVFGDYKRANDLYTDTVRGSMSASTIEHYICDYDAGRACKSKAATLLERLLELEPGGLKELFDRRFNSK